MGRATVTGLTAPVDATNIMTMTVEQRIVALQARGREDWIDERTLAEVFGLSLGDRSWENDFRRWSKLLRRPVEPIRGAIVNRFALETYFHQRQVLPTRWAAARLGMSPESLESVVGAAAERGVDLTWMGSRSLIVENVDRILIQLLPPLQQTIFSSHNALCSAFHKVIDLELGVGIAPLRCVTSSALKEQQMDAGDGPDYAYSFCLLTDAPIGIRYRIWLDLGKPLSLSPDFCSYVAYFAHEQLLTARLAQYPPDRPAGL
jgi:hypothetical protein